MKRLLEKYATSCRVFAAVFVLAIVAHAQLGVAPTLYKVSQLIPYADAIAGCNWKTGLNAASSSCADDSAYVINAMARGTVSNPVEIFFDVSIGIGQPLYMPTVPYVQIDGIGSHDVGIFVLSGSNSTAICNRYPGYSTGCGGDVGGTPPSTGGFLKVSNIGINGNRGAYPNGNSNATDARCTKWCLGISVFNLQYFETDAVEIYDAPTYATLSSNIDREVHRAGRVIAPSGAINTDGIHKDGPFGTYAISDMYLQTGDDPIALNLPEGYGGNGGGGTMSGITLVNTVTCMRLYANLAAGTNILGPVLAVNFTGSLSNSIGTSGCIRAGNGTASTTDEVSSVMMVNFDVKVPGWMIDAGNNIGTLTQINVKWNSPTNANPWLHMAGNSIISKLSCVGGSIYRTTTGNAAAYWAVIPTGSTVARMESNGCSVENETGQSYSAIPYAIDLQSGGSIVNLVQDTPLGGTTATPLVTSLFNGAQSVRVTNCLGYTCSGAFISSGGISAGATPPAFTPGTGGGFALACGTAPSAGPASAVAVTYCDSTQQGLLANFYNAGYLPLVQGPASNTAGNLPKYSGTNGGKIVDSGLSVAAAAGTGSVVQTVASGAKALATSLIASAACSSAQTATATGTLTTDRIVANFNGDPTAVTGYVPLTSGMLAIIAYPTVDNVNFKVCNNTASGITPGAVTINWSVLR